MGYTSTGTGSRDDYVLKACKISSVLSVYAQVVWNRTLRGLFSNCFQKSKQKLYISFCLQTRGKIVSVSVHIQSTDFVFLDFHKILFSWHCPFEHRTFTYSTWSRSAGADHSSDSLKVLGPLKIPWGGGYGVGGGGVWIHKRGGKDPCRKYHLPRAANNGKKGYKTIF
jgi:hypothetical protein